MKYIVKQGDYLAKIADDHGLHSLDVIWNHADNADLKSLRVNPNVLFPGDKVVIPELEVREESGATEKRHRFRLNASALKLRVKVLDYARMPVKDAEAIVWLDADFETTTTDASGMLEREVSPVVQSGRLRITTDQLPIALEVDLNIGHLDPVNTVQGQIGRLNNLGYDAGPVRAPLIADDKDQVKSAIEEFQCDYKLSVDGIAGPNTQTKLKEIHGC